MSDEQPDYSKLPLEERLVHKVCYKPSFLTYLILGLDTNIKSIIGLESSFRSVSRDH